ncbi:MAG: hypothetical protein AB4352_02260 [Hormoscilla sp.]
MKGYIQGQTIIMLEALPENIKEGDEVEIAITPILKKKYPFPTFELEVKEEYLSREKIYEREHNIL